MLTYYCKEKLSVRGEFFSTEKEGVIMTNTVLITVLVGVGYMVLKYLVKKLTRIELKEQTKQRV